METDFLASGNHFLPSSQIFLKESFIPVSGNAFFNPKKRVCFLFRAFFHARGNRCFNYREAYLKLCQWQPFFIFFRYSCQWKHFSLQQKRILKEILHSREWKPIFCLVETVFFYLEIFFLLVETAKYNL